MNIQRSASRVRSLCLAAGVVLFAGCASQSPAPVVERSGAPTTAASARDSYVVKAGDTLYSIARDHGMDYRELIALNRIENPNRITPGLVLKVKPVGAPVAAGGPVASTAPVSSEVVQSKPLGSDESSSRPSATGGETFKTEPRAGKLPYSDQALAQAQGQPVKRAPEAAEATPEVKPPEVKPSEAKAPEAAAGSSEVDWAWPAGGKIIGSFSETPGKGGEISGKGIDIAGKPGDPVLAAADGHVMIAGNALRGYGNLVIINHNKNYISVYAHNKSILVKEKQVVKKGQKIAEMGNTDADQTKLHFEIRRQGTPVDPLKYLPPR